MSYTEEYAHSVVGGVQNAHDSSKHHLREGSGPQNDEETPNCTIVLEKMKKEVRENDHSPETDLAKAFVVLIPAVQSNWVQCKTKWCRNGEDFVPVLALYGPVSVLSAEPVLRIDTTTTCI